MAMTTPMGYKLTTTFWEDFSIADRFGISAVKDTFTRAFDEWKDNYVYLTELSLIMNWKCWEHYENGNKELAELYLNYYDKTRDYAYDHMNDEELSFYFNVTD